MLSILNRLKDSRKTLVLVPHWDADGIASAALLASVAQRLLGLDASRTKLMVPSDGRYRVRNLLEDLDPDSSVVVTLDLALPEEEIVWLLERFPESVYLDHHRNLPELAARFPERLISKDAPANTILLQELLEEHGVKLSERERTLVKLGAICDRVNVLVTEPLLSARFLGNKRTVIEEAVTLVNSEYRAFWTAESAFKCLLHRSITDLVFNRYPECSKLHEARKIVSNEINRLLRSTRLVELEPLLYAEISSDRYIHGLLATMLMLRHNGRPVLVTNIRGSCAYLQLRTREKRVDFGNLFFELGKLFGVEAGGHRDGAGAVVPLEKLDEFLETLVQRVRELW